LAGGLEPPTAGRVLVGGAYLDEMRAADLSRLRRQRVGYVFQKLNLVGALTAMENVMLPLELDGIAKADARTAATTALERVGLEPPYDRFPDDLSGGEQQRVAIARAIVGDRDVLLADEPTGALDTLSADHVVRLLSDLAHDGTAVVLVTHEPQLAAYADRIVFLRDGAIVEESVPLAASPAAP
jgi:putative ABC transport system ATP-binding protein